MVMVLVPLFLVIASQVAAGPTQSWAGKACAEPGALRKESSGNLSACVSRADRQHAWMPLGQFHLSAESPRANPDCTGLAGRWVCSTDCATLGMCYSDSLWVAGQTCGSSEVCIEGACITAIGNTCPTEVSNVQCLKTGRYPDLSDCSKYYDCNASTGIGFGTSQLCSEHFYDACVQECAIGSNQCSWAISNPCAEAGTVGVAPNNDRLYYICTEDSSGSKTILWNKCETGHFNLASLQCDREDEPGCGSDTEEETTTTTTTTETTTPAQFSCTYSGVNPNPVTNCSFYYCFDDNTYLLIECADDYYFNETMKMCLSGQCIP